MSLSAPKRQQSWKNLEDWSLSKFPFEHLCTTMPIYLWLLRNKHFCYYIRNTAFWVHGSLLLRDLRLTLANCVPIHQATTHQALRVAFWKPLTGLGKEREPPIPAFRVAVEPAQTTLSKASRPPLAFSLSVFVGAFSAVGSGPHTGVCQSFALLLRQ